MTYFGRKKLNAENFKRGSALELEPKVEQFIGSKIPVTSISALPDNELPDGFIYEVECASADNYEDFHLDVFVDKAERTIVEIQLQAENPIGMKDITALATLVAQIPYQFNITITPV